MTRLGVFGLEGIPEITAGACREMRTPAYSRAANVRMTAPSPSVNAGRRVSAGLKRNVRIPSIVPAIVSPVTQNRGLGCNRKWDSTKRICQLSFGGGSGCWRAGSASRNFTHSELDQDLTGQRFEAAK